MSSRSRAARSYSWLAAATCMSFSSRRRYVVVWPAMKSQKSSTICRCSSALTRPTHGRRALADVAEQARPADLSGPLEHPGRAGPGREDPQQQVEGLADGPGVRVGAEVADPLLLRAAHHLQPRELLVEGHGQAGIALVVAVLDVEPRVELLDPAVLQLQGLDLGADHRPLHGGRGGHHGLGPRVQVREVLEVRRESRPQAARLADVDDPAVRVAEPVDPRRLRDRPRRGTVRRRISHPTTLRPPGESRCARRRRLSSRRPARRRR